MQQSIEKALLPFAYCSSANLVFDGDIEKATIFCITELAREKGGGFFTKQEAEKLIYISKVYYPFWLAPNRNATFILDGLNVALHTLSYTVLPDTKDFRQKLDERSVSLEVYTNFLSNHQNYFENCKEQNQLTIEGLLNDPDFKAEFWNYAKETTTTDLPITDAVLITPALNEEGVAKMLQKAEITRQQLLSEVTDLTETIKTINAKTEQFKTELREKIKTVEEKFDVELQKAKTVVDSKVGEINKNYLNRVTEASTKFNEQARSLAKEILKSKKELEQLDAEIEKAEAEIKTAAINKDDSAEQKWKDKRSKLKDERPTITSTIKEQENQAAETEEKRKNELFQLKQNNDAQVKEAGKELIEIETSRDVEINSFQKDAEKLEELSANIIKRIDELAKNREATINEFEELGTRQQRTNITLIDMPFYLACLQSKTKRRYIYYSPSVVTEGGLTTILKGLGKTKVSQLLEPRFRRIPSILNSFISLLDEDVVFSREISEACLKANLILAEDSREAIKTGLAKLNAQGWLSTSELEAFSQMLT